MKTTGLFLLLFVIVSCTPHNQRVESAVDTLSTGWMMQAEDKLPEISEESVSENDFNTSSWYKAIVPGTVLGSLVTEGVIKDPYFGINMQQVDPEMFKQPWWFRTTFNLTSDDLKKNISLRFSGINYRADLWVNGRKVVGKDKFAGAYRMFTFNINDYAVEGQNSLALKMWQHADGEYSIGFVDWNPLPRDRNMGIFRDVFLEINDGLKIRSPFVYSKVDTQNGNNADLFIQTELVNSTKKPVDGILQVDYQLGVIRKKVTVNPGDTLSCNMSPEEFPQLSVKDVNLWWPNGMGKPDLYNLKVEFLSGNKIIDRVDKKYGIREITSYLDERGNRAFKINGKFILLKGGGWTDDLLLQDTRESVEAQLRYVRQMNLNSIRCEGFWGKDETLYDLCDEYGIMVMIGWNCHWEWEDYLLKPVDEKYGGPVSEEDIDLISAYWFDQMMWLRNHPSIYIWMLGSDKLPAPDLEKRYVEMFKKYDPSRPWATSAGGVGTENDNVVADVPIISTLSGPTGMKMLGPYAFTPPVYWFTDTTRGGAYGFNTETCPGEEIPPLASLRKMFPEKSLWPIDKKYWEFHTGRNEFTTLDRFLKGLSARYGKSSGIEEFAFKSQVSNYELMRPMFEAFIANKPISTGLVQWKLNSAWPELIWQLYDTYLQPNGAFYAVREACTPLHAIYRYGFNDIFLANEDLEPAKDINVKIRIYDIHSKELFKDQWKGDINANTSEFIYKLPLINNLTPVWFLELQIYDKAGKQIDKNVYWLSTKKDILDYKAGNKLPWQYYTPTKQYADFTALNTLPKVTLSYDYEFGKEDKEGKVSVKVKNQSDELAFFIFFDLCDSVSGQPILPVFWSNNYVTLFPGEEQTYSAKYFLRDAVNKPVLNVKAWNVDKVVLK